jgi:3'(2'), 5'-bisphosphate nucleotidase
MASQHFQVSEKGLGDYVTSVDQELDYQLSIGLTALFPEDGIITEENPHSRQGFQLGHRCLWLIDPVDGTGAFIHHRSDYSSMVGLLIDYQPVAGWIYVPAQDRMYFGAQGWGLFQTRGNYAPESLRVIEPAPPSNYFCPVMIGLQDQSKFGAAIAQFIPEIQFHSVSSFGLKVLDVITGRAGLYLYLNRRVKLWDTTAPIALAKAAGLVCCDLAGTPLSFTPSAVNPETLAHLQTIIIGWPRYIEALRHRIAQAVASCSSSHSI